MDFHQGFLYEITDVEGEKRTAKKLTLLIYHAKGKDARHRRRQPTSEEEEEKGRWKEL